MGFNALESEMALHYNYIARLSSISNMKVNDGVDTEHSAPLILN